MGKFRLSNWQVLHYDSTNDEKKLYEKALEIADKKNKNISDWIYDWLVIQDIFTDPISIQQIKQNLYTLFTNESNI